MISKTIAQLCQERGISIGKLEKECGLGNATIRRWDKSSPTISSLKKVADYFEISVCELVEKCDG